MIGLAQGRQKSSFSNNLIYKCDDIGNFADAGRYMSSPRLPGQRRFSEGGLWSIIFPQYRDSFHNTPFRKCFELCEKVPNLCWLKLMLMAARLSLSPYNRSQSKNGHILPTGQWYAPSAVINDALIMQ